MSPPSGSNKRPTVYDMCKEKIKLRNQFQKSHTQTNFHDLKLMVSMDQNWAASNENSNLVEVCQQYVEYQQREVNEIKEIQSIPMSSKSELCDKNVNSFLDKVPVIDQLQPEEKTCSNFIKGTQSNSWSKHQKLKLPLVVCSICYAQFENKTELVQHIKYTHVRKRGRPAIPVECNVCQKKFTCKKDYAIHFRSHTDKAYTCLSCKKMCSLNVSHICKNKKYEKPRRKRVWDACKEVLTEKYSRQLSGNSKYVPKLPNFKKGVFFNNQLNKGEIRNFTPPSNKMVANLTPFQKKINNSTLININCVQSSIEQLLAKFKDFENLESNNPMRFESEALNLSKTDDTEFSCNICGISFTEMEKYDAHYSIHLDEEFCQIREGDEELQVCYICGGCFTETNAFQAHKLTHIDRELSDIKS